MPEALEEIRKKIEEKKEKKKTEIESVDIEQVEKIVGKMKRKYAAEGLATGEVEGKLGELRGLIAEGAQPKIQIQTVEDLGEFKSPIIRALGSFYLKLRKPMNAIAKLISKISPLGEINYYLYSANMHYSAQQWIAITTAISIIVAAVALVVGFLIASVLDVELSLRIMLAIVIAIGGFIFSAVICMLIPKSRAGKRGELAGLELPFALRHMATELRAGIGLYRTLQTIAAADYGVLSEELAQTITEIEEGTDAKDALRHLALRTQSRPLKGAIMHIIRALKTGGNLSEIMNTIAEDVSFEMRLRIRDFAEKMNFFGVIFIFAAIVVPVFVGILGSIVNAPLGMESFLQSLPLTPFTIILFYGIGMPLLLIYLIVYLVMTQPKL